MTLEFDDFDELAEVIAAWNPEFRQLDKGPFRGSLEQIIGERALLSHGRCERALEQRGDPAPGAWTFVIPTSDCPPFVCRGAPVSVGDIAVLRPGMELDLLSRPGFYAFSFTITEEHLADVADELEVPMDQLCGHDGVHRGPRSRTEPLARLLESISTARDEALPDSRSHASRTKLEQDATRKLVECLRHGHESPHSGSVRARRELFDRTRGYIAARAEDTLTVEELCRAMGTSQRTLYRAFRENCGVSPKAYLQAYRLNGVRRLLLRHDEHTAHVNDAANRWGFWHMGRFAADYRRQFGELPSHTLERSWRSPNPR